MITDGMPFEGRVQMFVTDGEITIYYRAPGGVKRRVDIVGAVLSDVVATRAVGEVDD